MFPLAMQKKKKSSRKTALVPQYMCYLTRKKVPRQAEDQSLMEGVVPYDS